MTIKGVYYLLGVRMTGSETKYVMQVDPEDDHVDWISDPKAALKLTHEQSEKLRPVVERLSGVMVTVFPVVRVKKDVPTREEAASTIAAIADAVPDDEIREHQLLRAITYMVAGLLDKATDDELIAFSAYVKHFGESHCKAFMDRQKDTGKVTIEMRQAGAEVLSKNTGLSFDDDGDFAELIFLKMLSAAFQGVHQ